MKRILLSLSLLSLTLNATSQTQIGNSDFEQWDNYGTSSVEPTNWNSFMNADVGSFFGSGLVAGQQVNRSSSKRPGSAGTYSAIIWCRSIIGVAANGNMTCGKINAGSATATSTSNYNKTVLGDQSFSEAFTDTPDSLVVWVRYKPVSTTSGYQARVSCAIHTNVAFKDPNDLTSTTTCKAVAQLNVSYAGNTWQRLSIPFLDVNGSLSGAYILTTFTTNKTPGVGDIGDSLYIDDLELIYVPKASFTVNQTTICAGGSVNFTSTSTNYPTSYTWNFGDGTSTQQNPSHTYATAGTYNVTLTATNQWGSTTSAVTTITVNPVADASFSYAQSTYCSNDANPTPTVTTAGTFSATPAGLSINTSTGVIDLAASTAGTYTVSNAVGGACPDTKTTTVTINAASNAAFSYPSNTICSSDGNQTPVVTETGTFSATPAGLTFVSTTTGEIDVTNSTVGTYSITHSVSGTCPATSSTNVTITSTPDASFSYAQTAYCADATDPSPVFATGANGGVFTSTTGLSINSNSGVIDLSASTAGTYTVTNTIAAVGSCPADAQTFSVTVNALPNVTLGNFTDVCVYNSSFTLTGGTPAGGSYSGTGVSAGSFNPAAAGVGTKTITYAYTDANNCSNTATNTILVDECLGLEDNALAAVSVYPNPTDGKLIVSNLSQETTFKVIATSGQVVLNGMVSNAANAIDLSSVENGVYMIQLTQEQAVQTIRIVKK